MTSPAAKRVLLTGATGVVGNELARLLLDTGHSLIFAARNTDTAWALRKRLVTEFPKAEIAVQEVDLGSLYSVREFAASIIARYDRLDGIINNASVSMLSTRELTADRFEAHFGINHLAHYALNGLLATIMPSDSRIVTVTSLLAKHGKIRFHDLRQDHGYSPLRAYSTSKLANLFYAQELHRQSEIGHNALISVAAHPGNILLDGNHRLATTHPLLKNIGHSPVEGARIIQAAFEHETAKGGEYFAPDGFQQLLGEPTIVKLPKFAQNQKIQERLWRISGQLTRINW